MKCKICNTEGSIYSVETVIAEYRMYLNEDGMIDYDENPKYEHTLDREIVCRECGHEFESEEELK
tara:strand:- start:82 stop:276 length:195 start_codon:yes stop_codon:yes gene_type:complete